MIRPDIKASIDRYVKDKCPPGGFIYAVLCNDLIEAFGRADKENIATMFDIVQYVYDNVPLQARGSMVRVDRWVRSREDTKG